MVEPLLELSWFLKVSWMASEVISGKRFARGSAAFTRSLSLMRYSSRGLRCFFFVIGLGTEGLLCMF